MAATETKRSGSDKSIKSARVSGKVSAEVYEPSLSISTNALRSNVMELLIEYRGGVFLNRFDQVYKSKFPSGPQPDTGTPFTNLLPQWPEIEVKKSIGGYIVYARVDEESEEDEEPLPVKISLPLPLTLAKSEVAVLADMTSRIIASQATCVSQGRGRGQSQGRGQGLGADLGGHTSITGGGTERKKLIRTRSPASARRSRKLNDVEDIQNFANLLDPVLPWSSTDESTQFWNGALLSVESCSNFIMQSHDSDSLRLQELHTKMEFFYGVYQSTHSAVPVLIGRLYAVQPDPSRSSILRGQCITKKVDQSTERMDYLFSLIDTGEIVSVSSGNIFQLTRSFRELPAQAFRCELHAMKEFPPSACSEASILLKEVSVEWMLMVQTVAVKADRTFSVNLGLICDQSGDRNKASDIVLDAVLNRISVLPVIVTHVSEDDRLLYYRQPNEDFEKLQQQIQLFLSGVRNATQFVSYPEVGQTYCCSSADNVWYRVLITKIESVEAVYVRYIDLGTDAVVPRRNLRKAPPTSALFTRLPRQAYAGRIACLNNRRGMPYKNTLEKVFPRDGRVFIQLRLGKEAAGSWRASAEKSVGSKPVDDGVPVIDIWISSGKTDESGERVHGLLTIDRLSGDVSIRTDRSMHDQHGGR